MRFIFWETVASIFLQLGLSIACIVSLLTHQGWEDFFWYYISLGLVQTIHTVFCTGHKELTAKRWHVRYLIVALILALIPLYGWLVLFCSSVIVAIIYIIVTLKDLPKLYEIEPTV
jgi:hypothetical protein